MKKVKSNELIVGQKYIDCEIFNPIELIFVKRDIHGVYFSESNPQNLYRKDNNGLIPFNHSIDWYQEENESR